MILFVFSAIRQQQSSHPGIIEVACWSLDTSSSTGYILLLMTADLIIYSRVCCQSLTRVRRELVLLKKPHTEALSCHIYFYFLQGVTEGYNGTIFAYGQTGSGKSFTMQGVSDPAAQRGVIPRAFEHIFESIQVGLATVVNCATYFPIPVCSHHLFCLSGQYAY